MPPRPLFTALAAAALFLSCSKAAAPRQRPPPAVTVAPVTVRDVSVEVDGPVDLRPIAQADVASKTLGYLDAVLVDRGDHVRRGQLLALVRPADLPDQLAAARGSLAQAQASAALARANKDRAEQLAPTGVVSQQDLQSSAAAAANAEASLAAAQANVAALATRLGETRIESPLDGVVSQRRVDPGALVGPTTGPVLSVERVDVMRAFVRVNESESPQLRVGQEARVVLEAMPGKTYLGKVVRIAPGLDPVARTLDAEVQVKNPGELRSGMYGRCSIVVGVHPKAVVVPALAIQISSEKKYVYVLRGEKVARVQVETGVDEGDALEVVKGLSPTDEIVSAGIDVLSDGVTVRPQRGVDPYTGKATASTGQGR
ncbi:MAG: efflux RND transporter periplasmic adaptor subunit [Deltaproteobacteria bacterium]|nr:efflux RND transporter periplasmic adaptor subunit [Deltaproteobacteria bacterium]